MALLMREDFKLPCGVKLSNRIAKAATSEHLADPLTNAPTAKLSALYERWSLGGSGLLITGNVMVDRRFMEGPRNVVLDDKSDLEPFRHWARACHAREGVVALVQISHPGRQCPISVTWERPVAPSNVNFALPGVGLQIMRGPRSLTSMEIEVLIARFALTSKRAVEAGFDGVQLHSAHGYLLSQFLSPRTNTRTDEWGGSPLKRRAFLLRTLAAVRDAVGPGNVVSVKLNTCDFQKGGLVESEAEALLDTIAEAGIVDLVELTGGTYEGMSSLANVRESTRAREGFFLEFACRFRTRFGARLPLMVTGGFRSRKGVEAALRGKGLDVVGLCRPLCLVPSLPNDWFADRARAAAELTVDCKAPLFKAHARAYARTHDHMRMHMRSQVRKRIRCWLKALLVPGLNYFWHQRQLQRLADGKDADYDMGVAIRFVI